MQRLSQIILFLLLLISLTLVILKQQISPPVKWTFIFDNSAKKYDIREIAVVGDFSDWQKWYYLKNDGSGKWQITIPLKEGWHLYRFVINNALWVKDPMVKAYDGPYSNSKIFVSSRPIPKIEKTTPATGSWLYFALDSLRFYFNQSLDKILLNFDMEIYIDSTRMQYDKKQKNMVAVPLPLSEGEHQWQVRLIDKKKKRMVYEKEGIYFVNLKNLMPVAEAGATKIVFLNQAVRLNAGMSFDPDFEPLVRYEWRQVAGKKVKLTEAETPFATFRANQAGRYKFRLMVRDSAGAQASDETEVIVLPAPKKRVLFSVQFNDGLRPQKVSLVGEFNNWKPEVNRMQWNSEIQKWQIAIELPPGIWEYKYVVNDSLWMPDPQNKEKVPDGWNGFNSLKRVAGNKVFEGRFYSNSEQAERQLKVAFVPDSTAQDVKFHWFSDINNPVNKLKTRANRLIFDKNWPHGNYYYYLVMEHGRNWSAPQKLLINHFEETEWMDLRKTPAWADTSVFYSLFVRKFTAQGDLKGVISELPYLKRLGVDAIWLLPVYDGPTEHGYAPTSLFTIEKDYGSLNDYRQLIAEAHRLGIKVIFDFIANHLSDQHRFVKAAAENQKSPLRSWFYWKPDGTWGYHNDWDTLVNLNFNNPWVRHYILNSALFWLNVGVDGFRCDVAWAIPHDFWKQFRRVVKEVNPQCLLLNEVLPRQWMFHDFEFDMSYDTDFYGNVLDVLRGHKPLSAIPFGMEKSVTNYPRYSQVLRYLENHDLPRFNTLFDKKTVEMMTKVLFTVPGTPLIYYGQEYYATQMRPQFKHGDNEKWFDFFKKHIKLRKQSEALKRGDFQNLLIDDGGKVWKFSRSGKEDSVEVIVNFSNTDKKVKILRNPTN
ncbi:alpha-amylase family glycosyl hydrolase [Caldithrix abyssi]